MTNPNSFTRLMMGCKVGNGLSRHITWYSLQEATMLIESDQESYNWINAQCMLIITKTLWVWRILIKSTLCTAAPHQAIFTIHIQSSHTSPSPNKSTHLPCSNQLSPHCNGLPCGHLSERSPGTNLPPPDTSLQSNSSWASAVVGPVDFAENGCHVVLS